jgi:hypothetical protein
VTAEVIGWQARAIRNAGATLAQLIYGVHPTALGWVCAGAAGAIAVAACEVRFAAPAQPSHNTRRMEQP